MKEQLISINTAKLAKQKGFTIPAPTQSLLQKWLRLNHNLDVLINRNIIRDIILSKYHHYPNYSISIINNDIVKLKSDIQDKRGFESNLEEASACVVYATEMEGVTSLRKRTRRSTKANIKENYE